MFIYGEKLRAVETSGLAGRHKHTYEYISYLPYACMYYTYRIPIWEDERLDIVTCIAIFPLKTHFYAYNRCTGARGFYYLLIRCRMHGH